ncbi:MAG: hypothetical protein AMS24_02365 [Chlamydiae bacterium SM23_39]|nr:MAG: hypothetical protein AMS24_02365 [Chlamydiae bacterium SM23_39]
MIKKIPFLIFIFFLSFCYEDITYEWLIECAQKTAYTDHIPHFRRLFNVLKVNKKFFLFKFYLFNF